ncbi:MAG: DUF3343 domain-containing protein [Clostridia bacterium]|nr:DUF3343 domain-containing protein [Clostridia bacterium]
MQSFFIRCPSVTYAQKGQKILDSAGYRSRLTKVDSHGCAYGLEISAPERAPVFKLLEDAGVIFTL